jgi:hypothetical protein
MEATKNVERWAVALVEQAQSAARECAAQTARERDETSHSQQTWDHQRAAYAAAIAESAAALCDAVNTRMGRVVLMARWTIDGVQLLARDGDSWAPERRRSFQITLAKDGPPYGVDVEARHPWRGWAFFCALAVDDHSIQPPADQLLQRLLTDERDDAPPGERRGWLPTLLNEEATR